MATNRRYGKRGSIVGVAIMAVAAPRCGDSGASVDTGSVGSDTGLVDSDPTMTTGSSGSQGTTTGLDSGSSTASGSTSTASSASAGSDTSSGTGTASSSEATTGTGGTSTSDTSGDADGGSEETGDTTPQDYACTQIVGGPQSADWFDDFEANLDGDIWQLLVAEDGQLQHWADREFAGWGTAPLSPCAAAADEPDRIVFMLGGEMMGEVEWGPAMEMAIAASLEHFPSVQHWILEPEVGGPDIEACTIDGAAVIPSVEYAEVDHTIGHIVDASELYSRGVGPRLSDCSGYADSAGRLTVAGSAEIGAAMAEFHTQ